MEHLRLATVWLGGCSGCHMSFLDLDELLIDLAPHIDVVYSPLVDTKVYPEGVDLALVEGAVCNVEHLELAHLIRSRTQKVVAFGDCAVTGNVSAMRNALGLRNVENVLQRAYIEAAQCQPSKPFEPGIVPPLLDRVSPLHEVIHVDLYLTGCPPSAARIQAFLQQVLAGNEPKLSGANLQFG